MGLIHLIAENYSVSVEQAEAYFEYVKLLVHDLKATDQLVAAFILDQQEGILPDAGMVAERIRSRIQNKLTDLEKLKRSMQRPGHLKKAAVSQPRSPKQQKPVVPGKKKNQANQRQGNRLVLISRRGKLTNQPQICVECGRRGRAWAYARSNFGRVFICEACKPLVFDRSFGSIDALDMAISSGFESNSRRH